VQFTETLTANQKVIYKIIRDFVYKKPQFTIDELFLTCKRNSDLTTDTIALTIDNFIRKKIIVPGSRLTSETVLTNERRAKMYRYIEANPGVNFNQIVTYFNIGNQVGYLHLVLLEKFGLIRKRKFKIFNLYFPHIFPHAKEVQVFLLRNPNILKIYQCLKYHPLNPHVIAKILEINYTTVRYHIDEMCRHSILIKDSNIFSLNPVQLVFLEKYFTVNLPQKQQDKIDQYLDKNQFPELSKQNTESIQP